MTATTATDASGVEYYFDCTVGGGNDSDWQDSATYEDTGLSPSTQYTYQVKARDKSANQNETGWSTTKSATTQSSGVDPNLILYWKLDETSGQTASDETSNGYDGALIDFPTNDSQWVTGKYNNALNFDGADDWVDIDDSDLSNFHNRTISVWAKLDTIPASGGAYVFGTKSNTAGGYRVYICVQSNGSVYSRLDTSAWFAATAVQTDTWYHFALVIRDSGSNVDGEFYVDGVSKGEVTGLSQYSGALAGANVGSYDDGAEDSWAQFHDGLIDQVRIYDYALSDTDVNDLANE